MPNDNTRLRLQYSVPDQLKRRYKEIAVGDVPRNLGAIEERYINFRADYRVVKAQLEFLLKTSLRYVGFDNRSDVRFSVHADSVTVSRSIETKAICHKTSSQPVI